MCSKYDYMGEDPIEKSSIFTQQNTVIQIVDTNKVIRVQYNYDPWCNLLSSSGPLATTLGKLNPSRYRGYVYDDESGLYYLNSRYYRPAWGRYINADTEDTLLKNSSSEVDTANGITTNNTYSYCIGNPLSFFDDEGMFPVVLGLDITMPMPVPSIPTPLITGMTSLSSTSVPLPIVLRPSMVEIIEMERHEREYIDYFNRDAPRVHCNTKKEAERNQNCINAKMV